MSKVVIYSTKVCPYCVQAKALFKNLGVTYEEVHLDDKPDLRSQLSAQNGGWRTVPMIFVNDEFLGGFSDVKALHDAGKLQSKLDKH